MPKAPTFDLQEAHKYFASHCFNKTWDYMDKPTRSNEEIESMIESCFASLWHWSQYNDATARNFSVGFWQASRVFAILGKPDVARGFAQMSLEKSHDLDPFYIGYAYEALARSEMIAGNHPKMSEALSKAQSYCDAVTNADNKKLLSDDLKSIK